MRKRLVHRVDGLLAQVPTDDRERAALLARANDLARNCGCGMGAAFLLGAVLLSAVYIATAGETDVVTLLAAAVMAAVATVVGKAVGILVATARMEALRRSLVHRLDHGARTDVHVH